jgi:hypothetical protein
MNITKGYNGERKCLSTDQMLILQEEVHLEILTFDNAKSFPIDKCQRRQGSKQ